MVAVTNDPTFPHSRFKCTMCDCYFNDDYAKRMHVKGRRHRLNYKKTYKPDLYVEPTNQQKKEYEKRKKFLQQRRMIRGRGGMVGGVGREPGGGPQPGGGNEDLNELRRQEAAELAKFRAHRGGVSPVCLMAAIMSLVDINSSLLTCVCFWMCGSDVWQLVSCVDRLLPEYQSMKL